MRCAKWYLQRAKLSKPQIARSPERGNERFRHVANGTLVAMCSDGTSQPTHGTSMSTIWEMAETIRAEEAAALAAQVTRRNRLQQWLAAFHSTAVTAGAELPVARRFPITRLAARKPGPNYLP